MSCKERTLKINENIELKTPFLLPSISSHSRIGTNLASFIKEIESYYKGPILTSAYDYDILRNSNMDFSSILFLDSGGYECISDPKCYDFQKSREHSRENWSRDRHISVLNLWKVNVPTVAISYDHPNEILEIEEQIYFADQLFQKVTPSLKEILLKPGPNDNKKISADKILGNLDSIRKFDIIGFTEKELGHSVEERMCNISKIRRGMESRDVNLPIHIFGNLDPVTTPLYFFVGADIFDSLSWLRFIFDAENSKYMDGFGPKKFGFSKNKHEIFIRSVLHNLRYIQNLERRMREFTVSKNFSLFEENCVFFEKTMNNFERGK